MLLELRLKYMREADLSAFQNSVAVASGNYGASLSQRFSSSC